MVKSLRSRAVSMLIAPIAMILTFGGVACAAEKIGIRLNWVPGTEHSYLFLGKEKGWYAEAGIDLDIIAGQGSTVAVKTVGAGETAFAIADVASVARGWEADVPIVVVAVLLKESPASIYSLKSKGIASIGDVCGKKIGINIKSTTTEQYRAMVRAAQLKDCKIEEVPISGGGGKDVMSGAVDAAVTFAYEDPLQIEVKGNPVNQIIASQFFKLYSLSLITSKEIATNKRALVDSFIAVTVKSINYALAHSEEAKQAFLKTAPEADLAYENAKFDAFMKLMVADDPTGGAIGKNDAAGWRSSLKTLKDLGIISAQIDPNDKFVAAVK
jgi:NitT/TauT family transport system substrate-binding protein